MVDSLIGKLRGSMKKVVPLLPLLLVVGLAACAKTQDPEITQSSHSSTAQPSLHLAATSTAREAGTGTRAEADGISITLSDCKVSVQPVPSGRAKVFSTQATVINHNPTPTYDAPDFTISFGIDGSLGSLLYQLEIPQPVGLMPASESSLATWYGESPGVSAALNRQASGPVPCSVMVIPVPSGG
jgi:hypothetical protein